MGGGAWCGRGSGGGHGSRVVGRSSVGFWRGLKVFGAWNGEKENKRRPVV